MREVSVDQLDGDCLDRAVMMARPLGSKMSPPENYSPRSNWSDGGPIFEMYIGHIEVHDSGDERFEVGVCVPGQPIIKITGQTMLIAGMRAVLAYELGETIKLP